jgi:hypothetical protein
MIDLLLDTDDESFMSNIPKVVIKYVQIAKMRFGTPDDNRANRECVRRYVSSKMSENDVRYCDQLLYIDQIVFYTFRCTDTELYWRGEELAPDVLLENSLKSTLTRN